MKTTRLRMCRTPRSLEIFEYLDHPLAYDFKTFRKNSCRKPTDDETKLKNRRRTADSSRGNLRRLVDSNVFQWFDAKGKPYKPIFLTLTFEKPVTELEDCTYEVTKFIQKINHYLGHKRCYLKYLVVPEIQKKREEKYGVGVWHFHVLIFNLPFVENIYDVFSNKWGNGFLIIKSLDNVKNIGFYISKYMSKDKVDKRLIGKKVYFGGKKLHKPEESRNEEKIIQILFSLPKNIVPFELPYNDKYHGHTKYYNFNLS